MDSLPLMAKIGSLSGSSGGAASPSIIPGKYGSALSFDGVDDMIDMGNLRSTCFGNLNHCPRGHTIAFWLNVDSTPIAENYFIYSAGGQTDSSYGPSVAVSPAGDVCAWYSRNGEKWSICRPLTKDKFVHVVVTWLASDGLKLHVDRVLVGHDISIVQKGAITSVYNNLYFGRPNHMAQKFGKFIIDSFMFWNDTISQDMIDRIGK